MNVYLVSIESEDSDKNFIDSVWLDEVKANKRSNELERTGLIAVVEVKQVEDSEL